jgi:hypothetical protein
LFEATVHTLIWSKTKGGGEVKISKTSLQICKNTEMPQKLFKDAIFSKKKCDPTILTSFMGYNNPTKG